MSVARQVVIDDTDSHITYSGNWSQVLNDGSQNMNSQGIDGLPYNGTSHGVTGNGKLTFVFEGTSISLWGSSLGEAGGSVSFCAVDGDAKFIDGHADVTGVSNNWKFCDFEGLKSSSHVFQLYVGIPLLIWVDRLQFTPSFQAILENNILLVNFTDAGLTFHLDWQVVPGTGRMTVKRGSQATFNFIGKSVTWIGFIPANMSHDPATAFFSIDGGPSTSFTLSGHLFDTTSTVRHQEFFTTPEVEHGSHSLVVTYNGSDFGEVTPLTLEYLYLNTYNSTRASISASVPLPSATPPSATPPNSQNKNRPNLIGALVGSIVGGLVLVIALITILCLWKRLRLRHLQNTARGSDSNGRGDGSNIVSRGVAPFTFFEPFTFGTQPFVKPSLHSPPSNLTSHANNNPPTMRVKDDTPHSHIVPQPLPIMSESIVGAVAQPPNFEGPPVRYRDSGQFPFVQETVNEEDMPPSYTTSWNILDHQLQTLEGNHHEP